MIQNKHKIGDKVVIRSLEWCNANKDKHGWAGTFIPQMTKYCGNEAIIEESIGTWYLIDIDEHSWYWKDEMFEDS